MSDLLNLVIDGHAVEVKKGTTILQAARAVGVDIPTFCYHPGLSTPANCRMCLVNTNKAPKLLPACYATCMEGMEVTTTDEKTLRTRKSTLEFILLHHPVDCPICDQAGECVLQDNYFNHSHAPSRLFTHKGHKPKAEVIGPNVILDAERCIVCTRCVRFCEEITKTAELTVVNRGERSFVKPFPGRQVDNDYATCVTDICPVGALTSRDFRFKMRVWFLESAKSVCSGCARGCNIEIDHGKGEVQRYKPRYNADINAWWMCDPGRLSYKEFQPNRIRQAQADGRAFSLKQGLARAARLLKTAIADHGADHVALVPSLLGTNEDLAALFGLAKTLGLSRVYEGGRAAGKEDDFLQRADKNPNRRGLRDLATAAETALLPLSQLAADIDRGAVAAALIIGHEHAPDDGVLKALGAIPTLGLASNESAWTAAVDLLLPIRTCEESAGHWTNFQGVSQTIEAGPKVKGEALQTGDLLLKIGRQMGHMDVVPLQTVIA